MNQQKSDDTGYLLQAVALATENVAAGRAPFGAVVVRDGELVATGVNTVGPDPDPTAHAEVAAVRAAADRLGTADLTGATVYSSCEPCAMCQAVCAVAGVSRIVYAAPKEFVPESGDPPRTDLAQTQAVLRELAGETIVHIPVPGADEPFRRHVELGQGRS